MAEGIVGSLILQIASSFTSEAGKSLWSCCVEEASMLASVKDDMEDINKELKMIQSVIRKIDPLTADGAPAAVWMEEVREAAYEIEDIIDEFTYLLTGERQRGFLSKTLHLRKNIHARHDPLPFLKSLLNLVYLDLSDAYDGEELCFQVNAFPSLKVLYLVDLSQLRQITIEERAIPNLKVLGLFGCRELKTLPPGIEHLTTLQELCLRHMSEEQLERLRGQGVDCQNISHIPKVSYFSIEKWETEMFS